MLYPLSSDEDNGKTREKFGEMLLMSIVMGNY